MILRSVLMVFLSLVVNFSVQPPVMSILIVLLMLLWIVPYWYSFSVFHSRRCESMLIDWTLANGCKFTSHGDDSYFSRGPFQWITSQLQIVWRFHAKDKNGREHSGWICFGSYWWGMLLKRVRVKWDEGSDFVSEEPSQDK